MKKIFALVMIISFNISAPAQYHPFLENPSWVLRIDDFFSSYNLVIHNGIDVVIGEYTYKRITDPVFQEDIFFREDILNRKVYKRINDVDVIAFDFSLQLGNNITLANGVNYTVSAINYINVADGTQRKIIHLTSNFYDETWIEGVGNFGHPLRGFFELFSDPVISILCSFSNGSNIYNSGLTQGNPLDCVGLLNIQDYGQNSENINFAPNPFTEYTTITLKKELNDGKMIIYNQLGQIVRDQSIKGFSIILNRQDLKNGVYIIQLFEDNKLLKTNKLILTN